MFLKYDSTTYQLQLIGGSANEGSGISEFSTDVLAAGIYFVAISGYNSTGNFAFAYCESTTDINYEINDTAGSAANVPLSTNIIGVIDNPYDYDYYEFTNTSHTKNGVKLNPYNGFSSKNAVKPLKAAPHRLPKVPADMPAGC